jgi:oligopeptide transport system substrate-binding protein
MRRMIASVRAQSLRQVVPFVLLAGVFAGALAIASGARLEPADFTFNNGTEVTTLDPATVTGVPEGRVIRAIFEGLVVKHPETLEPLPGVAESWELSEDGLTYTFHLRDNARWSNGDAVTSADFMFSFERFLNPLTAAYYAYQLWYVQGAGPYSKEVAEDGSPKHSFDTVGIKAPDEYTLEITLSSPTPFFLDLVGFYPLFPVNRRNIEEAQAQWPDSWELQWLRPENIITNGPYNVKSRRVNDRIRLVKNDQYWDADNVAFNTIDATAVEQDSTMLNLYLTGAVHWIDRVNTAVVDELMPREDFQPMPYLGSYFYRVNVTKPPFDDKRVRKALSLTIPRQQICENIMKMGQVPAYALVPPGIVGYTNADTERENVVLAKELLAEAGYGDGGKDFPTIEIHYNTSEAHSAIAQVIAIAWQRDLDITAKLLNQEWKVYLDTQNTLSFDVSRSAWIGDYADPNTFLDLFVTGGENNKTGWGNEEYDRLIQAASRELDAAQRMLTLQAAEALLMEELPILPIYYYVTQNVSAPRLGGYFENVLDEHFPKFLYWMDDDELAEKRSKQPADWTISDSAGPPEGLYSPAQTRARAQR